MTQRILIVGAGFAGLWSALGAVRVLDAAAREASVEVAVIAPQPVLHLRPRLHEAAPHAMTAPLGELFAATGIRFVEGKVETIDAATQSVTAVDGRGRRFTLGYDRLVLATGSELNRPPIPGLAEHAFSIDQVADAAALETHLAALPKRPESLARNTVIIGGGGFTGIELACELPQRLQAIFGSGYTNRVILVERAAAIGPDLGPGPRPVIEEALTSLGVISRLDTTIAAIDSAGVWTTADERIEAQTVVWTAGLRASPLTQQIRAERDLLGRLHVERDLRVTAVEHVFATGDVALALADDDHHALMSCQHAMTMGRFAGHNVAADLLGRPTLPYAQPKYVTCLDLGSWGAVFTDGWNREVQFAGDRAKAVKRMINTQVIYPPPANRAEALALANPNPDATT